MVLSGLLKHELFTFKISTGKTCVIRVNVNNEMISVGDTVVNLYILLMGVGYFGELKTESPGQISIWGGGVIPES